MKEVKEMVTEEKAREIAFGLGRSLASMQSEFADIACDRILAIMSDVLGVSVGTPEYSELVEECRRHIRR